MNKNDLKKLILDDLYRYTGKRDNITLIKNILIIIEFRYIWILRHTRYNFLKKNKFKFYFWRIWQLNQRNKYGFEISYKVEFGRGIHMNHFPGITINPNVKIGKNFTIYKGCTIGAEFRGNRKGVPNIGDKVWIGANSTIVGNIKVGNNVVIAPNTFVNFDIEDNSIIIGNPAKIIKKEAATKDLIVFEV